MNPVIRTLATTAALLAGSAFAQSALFLPNNSAGSALDTPPVLVQPPASPRTADTPKRTDPEVTAREQIDAAAREPVPRKGVTTETELSHPPRDDDVQAK